MGFGWSSELGCDRCSGAGVLPHCLRDVAGVAEPLQVAHVVVVARLDVVGVGADAVAVGFVVSSLALTVCALLHALTDRRPVVGEPVAAVAC